MKRFRASPPQTSPGNHIVCPGLPSNASRRVCFLCAELLTLKKSLFDHFNGSSLAEHLNSSSCLSIRANFTSGGDALCCATCDKKFPMSKNMNSSFLSHGLHIHDFEIKCIFCDIEVSVQEMYNHVKGHAIAACHKVQCKRCQHTYTSPMAFYSHLVDIHLISVPNIHSLNNYVADQMENRKLVLFGLFLAKHSSI